MEDKQTLRSLTDVSIPTPTNGQVLTWQASPTPGQWIAAATAALTPQAHIADPAGGATVDAEARAAIASILDALEALLLVAGA